MSRVAVVSTSINETPAAYETWARQGDLIVAGDLNSPPGLAEFVTGIGGRYIHPDEQKRWEFNDHLGWNCIQRRNAAVMQAYADRYDYVVTVDDDNHPTSDWVERHVSVIREGNPDAHMAYGKAGWVDAGHYVAPRTRQRGTPYGIDVSSVLDSACIGDIDHDIDVIVSMGQVLGDPDCDAVTRIAHTPHVERVTADILIEPHQGTLAAFNSQATLWHGEWAPFIACIPGVGRYDDIFASFIAEVAMTYWPGTAVHIGSPTVYHDRNVHDATRDLRAEIYGMETTLTFTRGIQNAFLVNADTHAEAYRTIADHALRHGLLPPETTKFMLAWANDWEQNAGDRT